MIKINGMQIEQVDYEYGLTFPDDPNALICEDIDDAHSAYKTACEFDGEPSLVRRAIFVSVWQPADDELVTASVDAR
jgi:hypothetical protein